MSGGEESFYLFGVDVMGLDHSFLLLATFGMFLTLMLTVLYLYTLAGESSTGLAGLGLGGGGKKDCYLMVGLSGAGKTVLWSQLRRGAKCREEDEEEDAEEGDALLGGDAGERSVRTHTSVKENDDTFPIGGSAAAGQEEVFHISDIPGHERLRARFLDEFSPITKAVIFVIDSVEMNSNPRSCADCLYDVLINSHIQKNAAPILLVCNKQDILTAKGKDEMKEAFEECINEIRNTRASALEGLGSGEGNTGGEADEYLGYENKAFKFEDVENPIDVCECCAIKGDISEVKDWIRNV
eukprot:Nk52_evm1s2338 gene=Nk52_evmTU1s2338